LYSLWAVLNGYFQKVSTVNEASSANVQTKISAILSIGLLGINRFATVSGRTHALLNIATYILICYCLFMPKSRWQELAFLAWYATILSQVRWRMFAVFRDIPAHILIAIIVLWVAISGSIFLFLTRRKTPINRANAS
jgi:hypothetical protein